MNSNLYKIIAMLVVVLLLCLGGMKWLYDNNQALRSDLTKANQTIEARDFTITEMKKQTLKMQQLDQALTQELNHANQKIDDLNDELMRGTKRLQFNHSDRLSNESSTACVDDGTAARLSEQLRQNYIHHLRDITQADKQIKGLQGYISALPEGCVQGNSTTNQLINKEQE